LRNILSDCKTILDLGCGGNSPLRFLQTKTYGIDASISAIKAARKNKTHNLLKVMEVKQAIRYFKPKSFEAVVALDLIEHLNKEDGYNLLSDMEKLAIKKSIIFTPNGFIAQSGNSTFDLHRSGWTSEEFKKLGYKVYGMYGPKSMRSEYHQIRFKPEFIFALISDIIQWTYTLNHPTKAAALLTVKNL